MGLQERNERLFYRVLMTHTPELLPVIDLPVRVVKTAGIWDAQSSTTQVETCCDHCITQAPWARENVLQMLLQTVGHFAKSHGLMFRSPPRGLYLGLQDRGTDLQPCAFSVAVAPQRRSLSIQDPDKCVEWKKFLRREGVQHAEKLARAAGEGHLPNRWRACWRIGRSGVPVEADALFVGHVVSQRQWPPSVRYPGQSLRSATRGHCAAGHPRHWVCHLQAGAVHGVRRRAAGHVPAHLPGHRSRMSTSPSSRPVKALEAMHAQHKPEGLAPGGAPMTDFRLVHHVRLNMLTCDMTGTDNEELLGSPFYVGARHRRVRGEDYRDLLDETLEARAWSDQLSHVCLKSPLLVCCKHSWA